MADSAQHQQSPMSMLNLAEIQMRTAQKLWQEQLDLARECAQVTTSVSEPSKGKQGTTSFMRAPMEIGQQVQQRMISSLSRQWEILMEARDEFGGVAESAGQNMQEGIGKAQDSMREAADQVRDNMQAAHETARKTPTKSKRSSN